jgi:F-type H+-transporting ATPase subunit b
MRRGWAGVVLLLLVLAVAACAAGPAWAAEGEKAHEPGLLDWRADLGIWSIVVFVLLLLVLRRWAWGPMLQGLQAREKNIEAAMVEAQKAREEAQRMREEFRQEIAKSEAHARGILDEARRDAQRLREEEAAKSKTEIQAERDRLHREIEAARDQALQQLWDRAADLATVISSKAIRRQLDLDDHRRLTEEALAELNQAASQRQRVQSTV